MASAGSILITGANGGLGCAIVKQIINSPDLSKLHGIYTVRKVDTATALSSTLSHSKLDHSHDTLALDLSSLANVRQFAAGINKRVAEGSLPPIRALIPNAGFQEHSTQTLTDDGFDVSFESNYLSHWLLVLLLLQSMDKEHGRIVVIGSFTHDPYDPRMKTMDFYPADKWRTMIHDTESIARGTWSTAKEDPSQLSGLRRYGASKLCQIMMIPELQRRLNNDPALSNISVLGVDPGAMPSGLVRRGNFMMSVVIGKIALPLLAAVNSVVSPNSEFRSTATSARDVLWAAFDVATIGEHPRGQYHYQRKEFETSAEARDQAKQAMLWRDSISYTGITARETLLAGLN
ncbi:putative short-chain dehydrogenase [Lasiosphaeria miniovina]|uniref:Short-chain dehydrogenase n=1 Tax=Lasiosphaeria miniovina TaxID=1954250 RepID=A0AA40AE36_9PEZI|nr:putative short-chain dehydrogenase [Lasiosphaeria miniovina]KAK0714176.1 putative short-chain dehydrogenase [Lasiosphaeria miniovina]